LTKKKKMEKRVLLPSEGKGEGKEGGNGLRGENIYNLPLRKKKKKAKRGFENQLIVSGRKGGGGGCISYCTWTKCARGGEGERADFR